MIRKISFSNFFSFKDEATVDFTVDKNAPDSGAYIKSRVDDSRISKINFVFGHNASGKTNLLRALSFIQWFTRDSFRLTPVSPIPFLEFKLSSDFGKKSSTFELEFETEKTIYSYTFTLLQNKITEEKLLMKNKDFNQKTKFKTIFSRISEGDSYRVNLRNFDIKIPVNNIRKNASIVSTGFQFGSKICEDIVNYLNKITSNVTFEGSRPIGKDIPYEFEMIKFYDENEKLKNSVDEFIQKFDLGLNKINLNKNNTENRIEFRIEGVHAIGADKKEFLIPFNFESKGTRSVWFLMGDIVKTINKGGVAILDEADNDLHPLMMSDIVQMISSESKNPNAQFICSSHSLPILNLLDKQQIILVEKDNNGVSQLWRLSDMKGIRADDNYYAKYLAGAYGAVPQMK